MSAPTVVVTGASAGVGRATAHAFAAQGARVGLLARSREALQATADEIRAAGGVPLVCPLDVADADAVEEAADTVEERLGPIDVWVNNAMVTVLARVWDVEPDEFRRVVEVNLLGTINGTLAALARMRPRDRGTIVQVGSALAFRGIPLQSAYCATKHGVEGFTESLRTELLAEDSGVHLGIVHLPGLNTPQFDWCRTRLANHPQPVPPIYQPEVAAEAITWAVARRRPVTWVAGSTVGTIVGNRLAPRLLARYLSRTGIDGQQTDQPIAAGRPDNLFDAAPGPHATHGAFDDQAHDTSLELETVERLGRVLAGGLALAGLGALAATRRTSQATANGADT